MNQGDPTSTGPERGGDRPDGSKSDGTGRPDVGLPVAGCLYLLMMAGGYWWLWLRDRQDAIAEAAIGAHGIWMSAGAGLLAGLVGTGGLALASRLPRFGGAERKLAEVLGPLSDRQMLGISLVAAVAEEFFFRLAVQDAMGWPAAVAFYVVLNTGPGLWVWMPIALVSGLLFSGLVALGFGLLSATVAHAVINYLSLRRIVWE